MPRRDELTYDVDPVHRSAIPWRSVLVLVGVVAVTTVLIGWVVLSSRPAGGRGLATGVVVTPSPSDRPATASADPSTEPSAGRSAGSDDGEETDGAPTGSVRAAELFVQAWLDRDPATRERRLAATAVPALAEQLGLTAADNIPVARAAGVPSLEDASTYSVSFVQRLTSGLRIRIYLVADPQTPSGWSAASVEQA